MKTAQVGTRTIKIVFFRVRPGLESDVVSDLRIKLKKSSIRHWNIFKVFGNYDLLVIYEPVEGKSFLFQGVIPNVISSMVLDCFTWQTETSSGRLVETFGFDRLKGSKVN